LSKGLSTEHPSSTRGRCKLCKSLFSLHSLYHPEACSVGSSGAADQSVAKQQKMRPSIATCMSGSSAPTDVAHTSARRLAGSPAFHTRRNASEFFEKQKVSCVWSVSGSGVRRDDARDDALASRACSSLLVHHAVSPCVCDDEDDAWWWRCMLVACWELQQIPPLTAIDRCSDSVMS
jgi:hypothetical protein